MKFTPCVSCKENNWNPGEGKYLGFYKCAHCGFLGDFKHLVAKVAAIILPDDPMDAMMCESCQ